MLWLGHFSYKALAYDLTATQDYLLPLPGQHLLGRWVVDQDVKQIFLLQHKEVEKAVGLYVCCSAVASIS